MISHLQIFKVLWAEPSGGGKPGSTDDTKSMRVGKHGENIYEKVRRFLIVSPMEGHCICLWVAKIYLFD